MAFSDVGIAFPAPPPACYFPFCDILLFLVFIAICLFYTSGTVEACGRFLLYRMQVNRFLL